MNWTKLENEQDLIDLNEISRKKVCLLFKYSNRCPTSSVALDRLERDWNTDEMGEVKPYFLDLIKHRNLSNSIAEFYEVMHESPQIILIENSKSIFNSSHFWINYEKIREAVVKINSKSES
jgi:bacillithiol system protein YtxJ